MPTASQYRNGPETVKKGARLAGIGYQTSGPDGLRRASILSRYPPPRLTHSTAHSFPLSLRSDDTPSTMAKFSNHQQKIIKNYYQNRSAISLQRLQELVTELYLAEGKKRERQWKLIEGHLEKIGMKPERIAKLVAQDDPALIAKVVEELLKKE
jgi:hypothetical protein